MSGRAKVDPNILDKLPDTTKVLIKGLNKIGISNELIVEAENERKKEKDVN